jgi:hypothetical protein
VCRYAPYFSLYVEGFLSPQHSASSGWGWRNSPQLWRIATNILNKQPRTNYKGSNLVKDENSDLLEDSHSILNRWKNCFPQLFDVYNVSDVRQIEVHTAELLVPGPSCLKVEIAV